jgi:Putative regulator of cell autolysis
MKMRMKILIVFLSSTLFILILQAIIFERKSSQIIYEQSKAATVDKLKGMQSEVYTYIKSVERNLIKIYNEQDFLYDLESDKPIEYLTKKYKDKATKFNCEEIPLSTNVMAVYMYDGNSNLISSYRRSNTSRNNYPKNIYEADEEKYNSKILQEYLLQDRRDMLISSYYNESKKDNIVRFAIKIYDSSNKKKIIGYLVCDVTNKDITSITKKYCNENDMFMWFQPLGDRPIISIGNLEGKNENYYYDNIEKINEGSIDKVNVSVRGNKVIFRLSQDEYNLDAYSIISQSYLEENQRVLTNYLIIIVICISIVIIILSILVSRGITKPLEQLTSAINKIKKGHMDERAKYKKNDEIGILSENFNEMLDQIEELISSEYEAKLLLNKAEYAALQAQINPHFLYNTLDTMGSIASIQNSDNVTNMCHSLSNIFRYSLDINNPYSTISKEILHLKNYIFLMNIRMNGEVEYCFDIDDSVLDYSLPKISIQPLVENALKHGLKNKRGEKKIYIRAHELDEVLQIIVEDNGVGMDSDMMNKKLKDLKKDIFNDSSSIGLININSRMKILYGDRFGLFIESSKGQGSRIILTTPKTKIGGDNNG